MRIKHQFHTLDKQKSKQMNIILPDIAVKLQTLAEKMSNTIYMTAKVCSYQSADADKLLIYLGKIHSFIYPSVYLMYEMNFCLNIF